MKSRVKVAERVSEHYKMYKDGKKWLFVGVSTLVVATAIGINSGAVQAETIPTTNRIQSTPSTDTAMSSTSQQVLRSTTAESTSTTAEGVSDERATTSDLKGPQSDGTGDVMKSAEEVSSTETPSLVTDTVPLTDQRRSYQSQIDATLAQTVMAIKADETLLTTEKETQLETVNAKVTASKEMLDAARTNVDMDALMRAQLPIIRAVHVAGQPLATQKKAALDQLSHWYVPVNMAILKMKSEIPFKQRQTVVAVKSAVDKRVKAATTADEVQAAMIPEQVFLEVSGTSLTGQSVAATATVKSFDLISRALNKMAFTPAGYEWRYVGTVVNGDVAQGTNGVTGADFILVPTTALTDVLAMIREQQSTIDDSATRLQTTLAQSGLDPKSTIYQTLQQKIQAVSTQNREALMQLTGIQYGYVTAVNAVDYTRVTQSAIAAMGLITVVPMTIFDELAVEIERAQNRQATIQVMNAVLKDDGTYHLTYGTAYQVVAPGIDDDITPDYMYNESVTSQIPPTESGRYTIAFDEPTKKALIQSGILTTHIQQATLVIEPQLVTTNEVKLQQMTPNLTANMTTKPRFIVTVATHQFEIQPVLTDQIDQSVRDWNRLAAGTYTATLPAGTNLGTNYVITDALTVTFTVAQQSTRDAGITVNAAQLTQYYDDVGPKITVMWPNHEGVELTGDDMTYTTPDGDCLTTMPAGVGMYQLGISKTGAAKLQDDNVDFTNAELGTLSILRRPAAPRMAVNQTVQWEYGATPVLQVKIQAVSGDPIVVALTPEIDYKIDGQHPGNHRVQLTPVGVDKLNATTATDDFSGYDLGLITVTKQQVTPKSVTVDSTTVCWTADGTIHPIQVTVHPANGSEKQLIQLVGGRDYQLNSVDVGSYPVVLTASGYAQLSQADPDTNFTEVDLGQVMILPQPYGKPGSVARVMVNTATMSYGEVRPPLQAILTTARGKTMTVMLPVEGYTVTKRLTAGSHVITLTTIGLAILTQQDCNTNFTSAVITGKLMVTPAPVKSGAVINETSQLIYQKQPQILSIKVIPAGGQRPQRVLLTEGFDFVLANRNVGSSAITLTSLGLTHLTSVDANTAFEPTLLGIMQILPTAYSNNVSFDDPTLLQVPYESQFNGMQPALVAHVKLADGTMQLVTIPGTAYQLQSHLSGRQKFRVCADRMTMLFGSVDQNTDYTTAVICGELTVLPTSTHSTHLVIEIPHDTYSGYWSPVEVPIPMTLTTMKADLNQKTWLKNQQNGTSGIDASTTQQVLPPTGAYEARNVSFGGFLTLILTSMMGLKMKKRSEK